MCEILHGTTCSALFFCFVFGVRAVFVCSVGVTAALAGHMGGGGWKGKLGSCVFALFDSFFGVRRHKVRWWCNGCLLLLTIPVSASPVL